MCGCLDSGYVTSICNLPRLITFSVVKGRPVFPIVPTSGGLGQIPCSEQLLSLSRFDLIS
jgi:hypothetical protein